MLYGLYRAFLNSVLVQVFVSHFESFWLFLCKPFAGFLHAFISFFFFLGGEGVAVQG